MTAGIDGLHLAMRYAHVVAGLVGLALFWVPVFATKGGRLHIRTGRAFAWCAGFVGLTGLVSSAWGLLDMRSFAGPALERIPERALPEVLEQGRFLFAVL